MKISVAGLWHLGSVTAACLANAGYQVLAFDHDIKVIEKLKSAQAPLFEPGLDDLIKKNIAANKLAFTANINDLENTEILWVTFDTPVDDNDHADIEFVIQQTEKIFPYLNDNAIVIISSQLPTGSTKTLQNKFNQLFPNKNVAFVYSPENLRLGKAIEIFSNPDRIVVGVDSATAKERLAKILQPLSEKILWMSVASAEMTKHAINSFLAISVVYANELASLCERVGANASEVERGLKTESRIGPNAYLKPGNAFAGGTLARDVSYLIQIGEKQKLQTDLLSATLVSNQNHKSWAQRRLQEILKDLNGKNIAVLGLAYKPGTDTLRRSAAIEACQWLIQQGAKISAYDPAISALPENLSTTIQLFSSPQAALKNADATLICNHCHEFKQLNVDDFLTHSRQPLVLDPSAFLAKTLGEDARIQYFSVGKSA